MTGEDSAAEDTLVAAVRQTFPSSAVARVTAELSRYGADPHERDPIQVRLAILRLSAGDETRLKHYVNAAKADYRNVLMWTDPMAIRVSPTELLDILRRDWDWVLPNPLEPLSISPFGNVLVRCDDGQIWRVCPEYLDAYVVSSSADLADITADPVFREDWEVKGWVDAARDRLGIIDHDQCYGFRVWPVLGGSRAVDGLEIKQIARWLAISGATGRQTLHQRALSNRPLGAGNARGPGLPLASVALATRKSSLPLAVYTHDNGQRTRHPMADYAAFRQWLSANSVPYVECQAAMATGVRLTGLLQRGSGVLFFQKAGDSSAYMAVNSEYRGDPSATRDYRQGDNVVMEFPVAWALPVDEIRDAFGHFLDAGTPASWLTWSADGVAPTQAVYWSAAVAEQQALNVIQFYAHLGLLASLEPSAVLLQFRQTQGRYPDASNPWDDVLLVSQATERSWVGRCDLDPDAAHPYTPLLRAWSALSLGEFAFHEIRESRSQDGRHVDLQLRSGSQTVAVRLSAETHQIDFEVLRAINVAIESSGYQLLHAIDGPLALVLCLTEDEVAEMRTKRRFPFASTAL